MQFLRNAPEGFHSSIELLNQFPVDVIEEVVKRTLNFVQRRGFGCDKHDLMLRLRNVGIEMTELQTQAVINALLFLYREMAKSTQKLMASSSNQTKTTTTTSTTTDQSAEDGANIASSSAAALARELNKRTQLSTGVIKILSVLWSEEADALCSNRQKDLFDVGRLVDFEWKLAIGVTSNNCKNLLAPMVTVVLSIQNINGALEKHSIEMTVSEFHSFSKNFRDMAPLMESL